MAISGSGRGGGGGAVVSVVAVEAADAPPSVVELLVVSERSRYLVIRSSPLWSSDGLDEEVEEADGQLSLMMDPFVRTPKRTGLVAYLTEDLGRHSTSGASVVVAAPVLGSVPSLPYKSFDPNFDKEFTHSCT